MKIKVWFFFLILYLLLGYLPTLFERVKHKIKNFLLTFWPELMGRDCFQPNSVNVDITKRFLEIFINNCRSSNDKSLKKVNFINMAPHFHCCFIEGQCPFSSSWFASFTQCLQTLFHNSFTLKLPTSWEIRSIYYSSSSELDTYCMITTWARPFTTYMDACLPVQNHNFRTAHRCSINIWISK